METDPHRRSSAASGAQLVVAAGLLCALAWSLPAEKPGAVDGRLSHPQFVLLLLSVFGFVVSVGLAATPSAVRRIVRRRVLVVMGSGLIAYLLFELVCLLLPPVEAIDNPWYLLRHKELVSDPELPFVRPQHREWEGRSRGDLAILNGDEDRFARTIRFETDHHGFRNGRAIEAAELAFVGDSFTEAGNVPESETFVLRIAEELGRSVRNLGRSGYSPPTERIVLERYALPLKPAAVIWQIAESNDLGESAAYESWLARGRPLYRKVTGSEPVSRLASWRRRSPSYRLFARLRRPLPWTLGMEGEFESKHLGRLPMRMLHLPKSGVFPEQQPGYARFQAALTEGSRLLEAQGIALLVCLVPMKFRAMAPALLFDEGSLDRLKQAGLEPPDFDPPGAGLLTTPLARLCDREGIRFLDLTPGLRQAARDGIPVYLPYDSHFSREGHQVVADLLAEPIRELLDS